LEKNGDWLLFDQIPARILQQAKEKVPVPVFRLNRAAPETGNFFTTNAGIKRGAGTFSPTNLGIRNNTSRKRSQSPFLSKKKRATLGALETDHLGTYQR
jgi:hypothetical protein